MYILITSAKDTDDLSFGFDRDRVMRQRELSNNKSWNRKEKNHVTIMLEDVFGFAQHQEKRTYRLGYQLSLTRNSDSSVLKEANATNIAKSKINGFEWYVPHYTHSMD